MHKKGGEYFVKELNKQLFEGRSGIGNFELLIFFS